MIGLFGGDTCAVKDDNLCEEVDVIADRFAVTSMFACKVAVRFKQ